MFGPVSYKLTQAESTTQRYTSKMSKFKRKQEMLHWGKPKRKHPIGWWCAKLCGCSGCAAACRLPTWAFTAKLNGARGLSLHNESPPRKWVCEIFVSHSLQKSPVSLIAMLEWSCNGTVSSGHSGGVEVAIPQLALYVTIPRIIICLLRIVLCYVEGLAKLARVRWLRHGRHRDVLAFENQTSQSFNLDWCV